MARAISQWQRTCLHAYGPGFEPWQSQENKHM